MNKPTRKSLIEYFTELIRKAQEVKGFTKCGDIALSVILDLERDEKQDIINISIPRYSELRN